MTWKNCERCGKEYRVFTLSQRFCSRQCWAEGTRGSESPVWKGGRTSGTGGYVYVRVDGHPAGKGYGRRYVKEHRVVMEGMVGRYLRPDESVHHVNGNRADNRAENLQLIHGKHLKGSAMVCGDCGSINMRPVPLGYMERTVVDEYIAAAT